MVLAQSLSREGAVKTFPEGCSFLKICLQLEDSLIHTLGTLVRVIFRRPQFLTVEACPWRPAPDAAAGLPENERSARQQGGSHGPFVELTSLRRSTSSLSPHSVR